MRFGYRVRFGISFLNKNLLIEAEAALVGGIPNIFRVWHDRGWTEPVITHSFEPDRTALSLVFEKASDKKQAIKTSDKRIAERQRNTVIRYLTDHSSAKPAEALAVSVPRARPIPSKLIEEDVAIAEGADRNRRYRLGA